MTTRIQMRLLLASPRLTPFGYKVMYDGTWTGRTMKAQLYTVDKVPVLEPLYLIGQAREENDNVIRYGFANRDTLEFGEATSTATVAYLRILDASTDECLVENQLYTSATVITGTEPTLNFDGNYVVTTNLGSTG